MPRACLKHVKTSKQQIFRRWAYFYFQREDLLMWSRMKEICKFTPRAELEKLVGPAKFQLEDRPAYYHGGGFVVCYSPMRFRVEGLQRVEYGQPGEYAVGMYHFSSDESLRLEMGLDRAATVVAAPIG